MFPLDEATSHVSDAQEERVTRLHVEPRPHGASQARVGANSANEKGPVIWRAMLCACSSSKGVATTLDTFQMPAFVYLAKTILF